MGRIPRCNFCFDFIDKLCRVFFRYFGFIIFFDHFDEIFRLFGEICWRFIAVGICKAFGIQTFL